MEADSIVLRPAGRSSSEVEAYTAGRGEGRRVRRSRCGRLLLPDSRAGRAAARAGALRRPAAVPAAVRRAVRAARRARHVLRRRRRPGRRTPRGARCWPSWRAPATSSPTTPTRTATTSRACRAPRWPTRSTARTRRSRACGGARAGRFSRARATPSTASALDLLLARGYRYDSSVFPSPPYYAAKALVMGGDAAGRAGASASFLDDPRVLLAPRAPVPRRRRARRTDARGRRPAGAADRGDARWRACTSSAPACCWRPAWLRRRLVSAALRAPFFNLELHGIDLADAEADEIPPALVARQPDLRRPLAHKLARSTRRSRRRGPRGGPLRALDASPRDSA